MMRIIAVLAFVSLAACGADGEPVQPVLNAGVSVGTSGVNPSANVGLRKGPVMINLGVF